MTTQPEQLHHGTKEIRGAASVPRSPTHEGRFGRMFRRLAPAPTYDHDLLLALAGTMRETEPPPPGGWVAQPTPQGGDNPAIPAGYTYLGQFIDHDITFDPNSSLQQQNDPDALVDFRSPRYDLDSVYGSGPDDEPFQYVPGSDPARMLVEVNGNGVEDLPRNSLGIAIIGDPRNDENVIVSQLQLAFLRLHNHLAEEHGNTGLGDSASRFREVQRHVRWTYQQMIVFDYLQRIIGAELVNQLFKPDPSGAPDFTLRYYRPIKNAYMPIEFSAAAFRFGHSQVRGIYDLNASVTARPIFLPGDVGSTDDLRGRRPLPAGWTIDWTHFVDRLPGANPQPSRLIDTKLVDGLSSLPGRDKPLALLNLLRGQAMGLPSGQDVARHLKAERILGAQELGDGVPDPTPLWYYLLKEAELEAQGTRLGPVGGRIVGEVILGLLRADKTSWVNVDPTWKTPIPVAGERPTLADILAFASG